MLASHFHSLCTLFGARFAATSRSSNGRGLVHQWLRFIASVIAGFSLLACSPPYDWRTQKLSPLGEAVSLEFPGKPLAAERTVVLAGQTVVLTLHGVQTESAQFALGFVPARDAQQAQQFAQALAQVFAKNVSNQQPFEPQFLDTKLPGGQASIDFKLSQPQRLGMGRFIWTARGAYELLVVGPHSSALSEAAEQFIRSFRFEP